MIKRPHILLAMEGTLQRTPAVLRAMSLARKIDAVLQIRSFEYLRGLEQAIEQGFDLDAYLSGRRNRLEEFAGRIREERLQVECGVVWGSPLAEKVILEALALKPDLVIKDSPAESAVNRAFLSGADWKLVSECPAPLMLVHPGSPNLPRHLLAAVDPLDEHGKPPSLNTDILSAACTLAEQCGAKLDVAHAYEFIPASAAYGYMGGMPDLNTYDELHKLHSHALYELCRPHGVPPGDMHVLQGDPALAIVDFAAARHADLVVMGSIYRTGFKHFMVGSTAEAVFDRLGCDVLVLKPAGFATELMAHFETSKPKAA